MNNSQFLAQVGHFFGAYSLVATTLIYTLVFHQRPDVLEYVIACAVAVAAWKEFYYDMREELPKQTWGDSLMDFAFMMLGLTVGAIEAFVALRIVG